MSTPDPMPCLDGPCLSELACQFSGSCHHRRIDAARSYEVAIREAKAKGIRDPFKDKEDSA